MALIIPTELHRTDFASPNCGGGGGSGEGGGKKGRRMDGGKRREWEGKVCETKNEVRNGETIGRTKEEER